MNSVEEYLAKRNAGKVDAEIDLFTRCSSCEAVFRIDESKLDAKEGEVRCGVCRVVFNAKESLVVKNDGGVFSPIKGSILQRPVLSVSADEIDEEIIFSEQVAAFNRSQNRHEETAVDEALAEIEKASKVEVDSKMDVMIEPEIRPIVIEEEVGRVDPDIDSVSDNAVDPSPALSKWFNAESDSLLKHNPFSRTDNEDGDGAINMTGVDDYIVDRPNPLSRIGWFCVSLVFIGLLGFQVRHYFVDRYAQDAQWRPALRVFCVVAFCELPARQDWYRFTITNTRVDLHPQQPGALRITVKVLNQAKFAQSYPELRLTLTDRLGRVVGRRMFEPSFFLGSGQGNMLNSGELGTVVLDLAKPHEKAVGFEMDIVKQPTVS